MDTNIDIEARAPLQESLALLLRNLKKVLLNAGHRDITIDSRIAKLDAQTDHMVESTFVRLSSHGKEASLAKHEVKDCAYSEYGLKHALVTASQLVAMKVLMTLYGFEIPLKELLDGKKVRLYVGVNESGDALVFLLEGTRGYSFVARRGVLLAKKEKKNR